MIKHAKTNQGQILDIVDLYDHLYDQDFKVQKVDITESPDCAMLSGSQREAFKLMNKFLNRKEPLQTPGGYKYDFLVVEGGAGMGKDFTVGKFFHWYLNKNPNSSVAFSAPSWDAVSVMESMSPFTDVPGVDFLTVQSLAGMRGFMNEKGKIEFKVVEGKQKFQNYGIVVINEASMLDTTLLDVILPYRFKCKIIFVGDGEQLPPPSDGFSPVYSDKFQHVKGDRGQTLLRMKVTALQEQHRTNDQAPALALANAIRAQRPLPARRSKLAEDSFLSYVDFDPKNPDLADVFRRVYLGPEFQKDANFFKLLCYTTNARGNAYDRWTRYIRKCLFATDEKPVPDYLLPGEPLKITESIQEEGEFGTQVAVPKNMEMRVVSVDGRGKVQMVGLEGLLPSSLHSVDTIKLTVSYYDYLQGQNTQRKVQVVAREAKEDWDKINTIIRTQVKGLKKAKKPFYYLYEALGKIRGEDLMWFRHDYVRSIHSAQGSSFQLVMYDSADIMRALTGNNDKELYRKLRYVGLTRSRIGMFILQPKM